MQSIFVIFIVIIAFSCLAGVIASRRLASNQTSDFFLAGRSIGWPLLFMTFLGTQVGGGFILGTADATYATGLSGAMYSIGLSFGMMILGLGIASRLRTLELHTVSEIFEKIYASQRLKQVAGVLSILSLGGILIALAIGLRKFLLSLSIAEDWMFLLAWLSVIAYTTHGGLLAVVWTDCVQAAGMVATLLISCIWILFPHIGDIQSRLSFEFAACFEAFPSLPIATLIVPMLFMLIEQDMAQRAFSAKSPKDATKACILTAISLLLLTAIPTSFGLLAQHAGIDPQGGSVFIIVAKQLAPEWVFLAAASAVLLAILSTASSVLLAVSSNAIQDIPQLESVSPKAMTFAIGIIAGILSYFGSDIISWMVASYEISVHTLFVAIIASLFFPRRYLTFEAAWSSVISGGVGFLAVSLYGADGYARALCPLLLAFSGFGIGTVYSTKIKALLPAYARKP